MDLIEKRSMQVASLALDGLAARHKSISSNIANADSPNYKRLDISFEDQLQRIIDTEDRKKKHKLENMFNENREDFKPGAFDLKFSDFNPVMTISEAGSSGINNVNIETEMSELAKNGMRYNSLAVLQQKAFQGMKDVIQQGGRS